MTNPRIVSKAWDPVDCVEWTYERDEGDLVVYARNVAEAVESMHAHGFTDVDVKKLKRTGKTLSEYLASYHHREIE